MFEKVQLFNERKVGREFRGFSSCPHLEQSCFVGTALALAGEKKLQPQEMSVTLTRSRERRNKWMEVCDQVLACISRASVLRLERGGPAPTATPSPWAPKMFLDPGFWDCPLRWMGAVSLSFSVPFKLFATLCKQLHPRA